jgi:hypothetical protein
MNVAACRGDESRGGSGGGVAATARCTVRQAAKPHASRFRVLSRFQLRRPSCNVVQLPLQVHHHRCVPRGRRVLFFHFFAALGAELESLSPPACAPSHSASPTRAQATLVRSVCFWCQRSGEGGWRHSAMRAGMGVLQRRRARGVAVRRHPWSILPARRARRAECTRLARTQLEAMAVAAGWSLGGRRRHAVCTALARCVAAASRGRALALSVAQGPGGVSLAAAACALPDVGHATRRRVDWVSTRPTADCSAFTALVLLRSAAASLRHLASAHCLRPRSGWGGDGGRGCRLLRGRVVGLASRAIVPPWRTTARCCDRGT